MQNKLILKWLNLGLMVILVGQCLSLILIDFIPAAILMHQVGGVILLIGACGHLYLNRAWVKSTYFAKKKG